MRQRRRSITGSRSLSTTVSTGASRSTGVATSHRPETAPDDGRAVPAETRSGLVGRADELGSIDGFLEAIEAGPSALLINGAAGAGKSTIWRAAVAAAEQRGFRVLTCRPAESEAGLAYAALGDLLEGMLNDAGNLLPPPQRRALAIATLVEEAGDEPPDQRAVAVSTLGLLRAVSARVPALVAIDDVQWLDRPTARLLEFALRRLRGERVGVLAVLRAGDRPPLDVTSAPGIPDERVFRVTLRGMTVDELDELFRRRLNVSLPRPTLVQVAMATDGNPLFALEIAHAIARGELHPRPGERLPVPETLQDLVRERLSGLPESVREALAVAAAAAHPTVELLERAGVHDPALADPMATAIRTGVVYVVGGRIEFTHPLFASTLYFEMPPDRRRETHRRLALVAPSALERARHLALATTGPDTAIATVLDEAAGLAARHGAPDAAADLLEEAARLTPTLELDRARRRRMEAADMHFAAGDTRKARELLEALVTSAEPGPGRAVILRRLARVRYSTDSTSVAAELLERARAETDHDTELSAGIERDLAWAVAMCGDAPKSAEHARKALGLVEGSRDPDLYPELLAATAMAEFTLGGDTAFDLIERAAALDQHTPTVPIEWRPTTVRAVMLKITGELETAVRLLQELQRRALDGGDETSLPYLLQQLSEAATLRGDWLAALRLADEGNVIARQTGQEAIRAGALNAHALASAYLGRVADARRSGANGLEVSEKVGSVLTMMLIQSTLGFLELSLGDPPAAYRYLAPLAAWRDVVGVEEPGMLRFVPDLVEASIALGQTDKADALLGPYEQNAQRLGRSSAQLAAAWCRALLTSANRRNADAVAMLERAVDAHAAPPFDRARALLVLGSIERRTRRRRSARANIESSLRTFDELGARLWALKARQLLGGEERDDGWTAGLTPAERRVALLVGGGATNRQAADRLFVTVRTVELHLTNIYRKLGIRSRSQLAHAIALQEPQRPVPTTSVGWRPR